MPEFVLREALKPRCGHYEGWEVALAHAYLKASNDSGEWASSGQQRDVTSLLSGTHTAASRRHPTTLLASLSFAAAHLCADAAASCKTAATRVVTGWHEINARSPSENARRTKSLADT
uniref:WGS project CAFE00000000 data, contig n=1 Tax=Ascaris lumbricoides TaxID=6252 RepID=A0A0M3HPF5_ASCLU